VGTAANVERVVNQLLDTAGCFTFDALTRALPDTAPDHLATKLATLRQRQVLVSLVSGARVIYLPGPNHTTT
jgi:hypothetical protein